MSAARTRPRRSRPARRADGGRWELRLYISGRTRRAAAALANLEQICASHLDGRFRIQVVDLAADPRLARGDHVLAVPTLVRRLPLPVKRIIGDLSSTERVLVGLNLRRLERRRAR